MSIWATGEADVSPRTVQLIRWAMVLFLVVFWLAVGSALTGCASDNAPPPAVEVHTVVEKVPVVVPCVRPEDIAPEPEHVASKLNGQAGHDLLIVDQSALDLRTWGEANTAQLKACAGAPGGQPPASAMQSPPPAQ